MLKLLRKEQLYSTIIPNPMRFYKSESTGFYYPSVTTVIHHEKSLYDRIRSAKRNKSSPNSPKVDMDQCSDRGTVVHSFLQEWLTLSPAEQMSMDERIPTMVQFLQMTMNDINWDKQSVGELSQYCKQAALAYAKYPAPIAQEFVCAWDYTTNTNISGEKFTVSYSDDDKTLPFPIEQLGMGVVGRGDALLQRKGAVTFNDLKTSQGYWSAKEGKQIHRVYLTTRKGVPNARHNKLTEQLAAYAKGLPLDLPKPEFFSATFAFPTRYDNFEFTKEEIEKAEVRFVSKLNLFRESYS